MHFQAIEYFSMENETKTMGAFYSTFETGAKGMEFSWKVVEKSENCSCKIFKFRKF